MNIPLTQSKKWQKLQEDLGEISHFENTDDYQYLAIEKHTKVGNYLFLPYGPVTDTKEGFKKALESLQNLAKDTNAIFMRIEPQNPEAVKYLPKSAKKVKDIEPAETWILDLPKNTTASASETTEITPELKNLLPSRLVRYYKNREKQGITVEMSHNPDDIKHLLTLQKALASKKGITTFTENYLKTELKQPFATLYLVKINNKIIAAGLVFDDDGTKTRYNLQGAQSEEGRPLHTTGILTIQLILDAYKKGYKTFDFWGIAPEGADSSHPWYGFTAFKKTFNGREQKYAGTYEIILKPTKYRLFKSLQKLQKIVK
jgi:lipid II:glycine glycyltransferase (peptidoglycan interpeptide bridge formation enzyme)